MLPLAAMRKLSDLPNKRLDFVRIQQTAGFMLIPWCHPVYRIAIVT